MDTIRSIVKPSDHLKPVILETLYQKLTRQISELRPKPQDQFSKHI